MDDKELKKITEIIGLKDETTSRVKDVAKKLVKELLDEVKNEN